MPAQIQLKPVKTVEIEPESAVLRTLRDRCRSASVTCGCSSTSAGGIWPSSAAKTVAASGTSPVGSAFASNAVITALPHAENATARGGRDRYKHGVKMCFGRSGGVGGRGSEHRAARTRAGAEWHTPCQPQTRMRAPGYPRIRQGHDYPRDETGSRNVLALYHDIVTRSVVTAAGIAWACAAVMILLKLLSCSSSRAISAGS